MTNENENGKSVVPVRVPQGMEMESAVQAMEHRIKVVERAQLLIQQRINPVTDIKKFGDKWRRTINFARKCYRIVGGNLLWQRFGTNQLPYLREERSDDAGGYYAYTHVCTWQLPWGETIEGSSMITSREPFFGIEEEKPKALSAVDEHDICEMGKSEAIKNAVFTGLGLGKDVDATELQQYGVDGSSSTGHNFDAARGARGGSAATDADDQAKRDACRNLCRQLMDAGWKPESGAEMTSPEDVLKAVTANPDKNWDGWGSFKPQKLGPQLDRIIEQLTKILDDASGLPV